MMALVLVLVRGIQGDRVQTRRRTDTWLALLALLLLLISPIEGALSNNLPDLLPTPVRDHILLIFSMLCEIVHE